MSAPPATRVRRIGEIFDDEARIVEVHHGGMGIVYVCEGRLGDVEGRFAVKTCGPLADSLGELASGLTAEDARSLFRRFVTEARTNLELLPHPNITSVFAVQRRHGVPYILMEHVDGPSLRRRLDQGPLSIESALACALQVARGLEFAHRSSGVVHRDIKPGNILLDRAGRAKIADFGLATGVVDELARVTARVGSEEATFKTAVAHVLGTLPYMAPEQFIDPTASTVTSDVYSFGVVLYEMLAGRLPFVVNDVTLLLKVVAAGLPPPIADVARHVPADLARLVDRCLAKSPEQRFRSFNEIVEELEVLARAAAVDLPVQATYAHVPSELILRKASGLINLGLSREALSFLERSRYETVGSHDVHFLAGTVLGNLGEHERAIAEYARGPSPPAVLAKRNLFNWGNSLATLGRLEEAKALYHRALDLDPTYTNPLLGLAGVARAAGDAAAVLPLCDRILAHVPDQLSAWAFKVDALADLGRRPEALEALEEARRSFQGAPPELLNLALITSRLGLHAEAVEMAIRLVDGGIDLTETNVRTVLGIAAECGEDEMRRMVQAVVRCAPEQALLTSLRIPVLTDRQIAVLLAEGKLDQAERLIDAAAEESPDFVPLLCRKAEVQRARGKLDEAIATYDDIVARRPAQAKAHHDRGNALIEAGRDADALAAYERAAQLAPDDSMIDQNRAVALDRLGRHEEALASIERALRAEPGDQRAAFLKARSLRLAGRAEEAVTFTSEWLERHGDDERLLHELSRSLVKLRRYEEDLACQERILRLAPKSPEAWHARGDALLHMGRLPEALASFMNAATLDASQPSTHVGIGVVHLAEGDYTQAETYFRKALDLDPQYEPARYNLMMLGIKRRVRQEVAATGLSEAEVVRKLEAELQAEGRPISLHLDAMGEGGAPTVELGPERQHDQVQLRELAASLYERGELRDALTLLQRLVREMPSDYEAWHMLGTSFDELGYHMQALSCFDRALQHLPQGGLGRESLNGKGEALRKLGRFAEAIPLYDQVIAHEPDHELAWNNKGICLSHLDRLDEARTCYDHALRANPSSFRALANLGRLESRHGREEAALGCCRRLEAMDQGHDVLIPLVVCEIHYNLDRFEDAAWALDRARAIDAADPRIAQYAEALAAATEAG